MVNKYASGRQIAGGAAWLMGFKLLDKSIGLISTLILVRILSPSDFGLVAMAVAVVSLTELMGAFGFDAALIQRQDAERRHYDTAWTFNVIFGVSIATLLIVLAVPAASFYGEPRLEMILPILAVGALFTGFENIGTVAFRKELNFSMEFKYLLAKRLASFFVVVSLAIYLQSFWALIFGTLAGKLMSVFISYRLHPYRPRFALSARADLFHFSKWLFFSNLIQFLQGRSSDFILGRTVGTHGLGLYNVSSEIAFLPSSELIAPLNRAVYPAYAQLAKARDHLLARFLEVFGLINLLAFPVSFGLFCLADLVVKLMLGPQWHEAVPFIQILGLCGLVSALQSNMYIVMSATGNPKANTYLSACILVVTLPTVVWASATYGAIGAAYAYFGAAIIGFIGIVFVFTRYVEAPISFLLRVMWRPALASGVMTALIFLVDDLLIRAGAGLLRMPFLVGMGALTYSASVGVLWWLCGRPEGAEKVFMRFVLDKFAILRKLKYKGN